MRTVIPLVIPLVTPLVTPCSYPTHTLLTPWLHPGSLAQGIRTQAHAAHAAAVQQAAAETMLQAHNYMAPPQLQQQQTQEGLNLLSCASSTLDQAQQVQQAQHAAQEQDQVQWEVQVQQAQHAQHDQWEAQAQHVQQARHTEQEQWELQAQQAQQALHALHALGAQRKSGFSGMARPKQPVVVYQKQPQNSYAQVCYLWLAVSISSGLNNI